MNRTRTCICVYAYCTNVFEEKPAEPEEPKELEADAAEDKRPRIAADAVEIGSPPEATMNVLPSRGGRVLMSLGDGGFQHLTAAARCSVGVKAGRYLYEVRILESKQVAEAGKVKPRLHACRGVVAKSASNSSGLLRRDSRNEPHRNGMESERVQTLVQKRG